MNFCEKCGTQLSGENFCPSCGNKIILDEVNSENIETPEVENTPEADVNFVEVNTTDNIMKFDIKRMPKQYFLIAIAVIIAVIVTIVIISSNSGPDFKEIYAQHCNYTWAEVGSDNSYLTVDTNPYDEEDNGVAYSEAYYAVEKINEELGLPSSLFQDMRNTTGADGKQEEEFEDITVSWKYHPDAGLEVTYKKK